jgi:hypothetical protein
MNNLNKSLASWQSLKWVAVSLIGVLCLVLPGLYTSAQDVSDKTTVIVAAANTFLDTLNDTQRDTVLFDYDDEEQRNNWSNLPTGLYTRDGLSYAEMSEEQRAAVLTLLETILSEQGYEKVWGTMIGDEILQQTSTGLGGAGTVFGVGQYYISILGTPSETDPWILQWGGHHLALNISFSGSTTTLAPSHTGCQPCVYVYNDQDVNVLGDEYALALELVNSLDADLQEQAILDYSITDLVMGPGTEEYVLEAEGLPASEMTEDQRALLLAIISEWVNIVHDEAAAARMAEIEANINETHFAWSGDTGDDSTSYFRITGPTLLIEFAPQGQGGGGAPGGNGPSGTPPGGGAGGNGSGNQSDGGSQTDVTSYEYDLGAYEVDEDNALYHVHTIYRDPTNPYGTGSTGE